jgi:hypothetical protein
MLMKTLIVPWFAVAVVALSAGPVSAQLRATPLRATPPMQLHAINRNLSLSAPATSPLQQQIQDDYATNLMAAQRERLQQNPSGLTRQERALGSALNGFSPR